MNCIMTQGLYLRANGRMPCYCSSGETITLETLDHSQLPNDFVTDIFNSRKFSYITKSMQNDKVPFPGICEQCSYLNVDSLVSGNRNQLLEWFHFEPSFLCNLNCRWCHGLNRRKVEETQLLPLETVKKIASDFNSNGYKLGKAHVCGVGEPTLNKNVWKMIQFLKSKLGGNILISTNGNVTFSKAIVDSGLDKIKIAVDAVNQKMYTHYRKSGQFEKVLQFTKLISDYKAKIKTTSPLIIWQYILFNYNDSEKDLLLFQKMAKEYGVDQLRIVYTRCNNYSLRLKKPKDFPVNFSNIDFFSIKEYSNLHLKDALSSFEQIDKYYNEKKINIAAKEAIRLANMIFHRLLLGVDRYVDLLSFTHKISHDYVSISKNLSTHDFYLFKTVLGRIFRLLANIRRDHGDYDQENQYLQFIQQTGL